MERCNRVDIKQLPDEYLKELNKSMYDSGEFEKERTTIIDEIARRAIENMQEVSARSANIIISLNRGE